MNKFAVLVLAIFLSACAARVESTYPVPEIPNVGSLTSQLHGVSLKLQPFVDARLPAIQEKQNSTITQPEGEVSSQVEKAFTEALQAQGVSMDPSSDKTIYGEIRRWESVVAASINGSLQSEAVLFLEVKDSQGTTLFSGEYFGSRASTFPVIAKQDVGDSLGLVMSEAITQAVRDNKLKTVLR